VDVAWERCAGIDVGKDEVVACVRTPGVGGSVGVVARPPARSGPSWVTLKRWRAGSTSTDTVCSSTFVGPNSVL
jgi:hypothetical protein